MAFLHCKVQFRNVNVDDDEAVFTSLTGVEKNMCCGTHVANLSHIQVQIVTFISTYSVHAYSHISLWILEPRELTCSTVCGNLSCNKICIYTMYSTHFKGSQILIVNVLLCVIALTEHHYSGSSKFRVRRMLG